MRAVGRVTGHLRPTLNVILPDWFVQQRELADRSLKNWIGPTMSAFSAIAYSFSGAELDEFLEWIFAQGFLQVPLFFSRLVEVRKTDARVAPTVLAKEAEGLSSTIEHLINAIAAQATNHTMKATWPADKQLGDKIQWLWSDLLVVHQSLICYGHLTRTPPGFLQQRNRIANVLPGDPHQSLVQHLLLARLVRNQFVHLSLTGFDREETHELIEVLLRTILLSWKHARVRGII